MRPDSARGLTTRGAAGRSPRVSVPELPSKTKEGSLHQFLVSDPTASVRLTVWDGIAETVEPGDILRVGNACVGPHAQWRGAARPHARAR